MDRAEAIDKIRKLYKLQKSADKIGSKGEAAAADKVMRKLLREFNISLEKIERLNSEKLCVVTGENIVCDSIYGLGWKRNLMQAIAQKKKCRVMVINYGKNMFLLGTSNDVRNAQEIYFYFLSLFMKMTRNKISEKTEELNAKGGAFTEFGFKQFGTSYLMGLVAAFGDNINAALPTNLKKAATEEYEKAINEYIEKNALREVFPEKEVVYVDSEIQKSGYEDGMALDLTVCGQLYS